MRYSEFKKFLIKNGCQLLREGRGHEVWVNPSNGQTTTVGRHDKQEVKTGTFNAMLKDLGLKK